ncbi:MAG: hypothetical protein JWM64_3 [Frankiales bacterium]|nr:hypothetical protein [Frankiales bacterium]
MSRTRSARLSGAVVAAALLGAGLVLPATATAAATVAGEPAATFAVYPAPGSLARDAGEPTLGVNWKTGKVMYQAYTETDQVTFDDSTSPATATWKDVSGATTSQVTLDPILETDSTIGRTFVSQLLPPCSLAAFTDSDGEPSPTSPTGYTPFVGCGVGSNFDHQTIGTGPTIDTRLDALNQGRLVYYCSQVVVESSCSVSRDGGLTFATSRPVYTFKGDLVTTDRPLVGCEGLHGHLNTSPVDGTAYLPNFACNSAGALDVDRPSVVVSPDEGLTWTVRQVPDGTSPNFDSDPAVDVDEGNRAYVAYENATSNMMLATTDDRGVSWTPSVDLGALVPGGLKNATMPTVVAGSAGRAAVGFLGTTTEAPLDAAGQPENQLLSFDPDGDDPAGGWHAYLALTYDGGATWTTTDVTPNDPVQRGCIWWGSARDPGTAPVCENDKRNLLDFIDISLDKQGRVVFGFADGCVGRCVTEGQTRNTNLAYADRPAADSALTAAQFAELYSQEDIGTIVRQQCGRGLYAVYDTDPTGPLLRCSTAGTGAAATASATASASGSEVPAASPTVTVSPTATSPAPTSPAATTPAATSPAPVEDPVAPAGGGVPAPSTSSPTTGSPSTGSAAPGSPATSPSATATAAPGSPTPTPTAGLPSAPCRTSAPVVLPTTTIPSGASAALQVSGTPGAVVDVVAYTRPSTTYRVVRSLTTGPDGTASTRLTPPSNTRLYAQQRGCPAGPSSVLTVRSTLSMDVRRTAAARTYRFSGSSLPLRAGGLPVDVYRVTADGREVLTARTRTGARGLWEVSRTFTGTGRFGFVARTPKDVANAAGASAVRSVQVR